MSKFKNTIKSKFYWINKGQGEIYKMLHENIEKRGDYAKLAKKIGKTPGYVSQIFSGDSEINPTWKKIVEICIALNKVPVLEIKSSEAYLEEQRIKTSMIEMYNMYQSHCNYYSAQFSIEIENVDHLELNNYSSVIMVSGQKGLKHEYLKENYFPEIELI